MTSSGLSYFLFESIFLNHLFSDFGTSDMELHALTSSAFVAGYVTWFLTWSKTSLEIFKLLTSYFFRKINNLPRQKLHRETKLDHFHAHRSTPLAGQTQIKFYMPSNTVVFICCNLQHTIITRTIYEL